MEDIKGQTIFLSIIGVATLLVAIIGATFAWFGVSVNGNEKKESVVITIASLGSITFNDGADVNANGILPGDKKVKTFTIAQTDPTATETIKYNIKLNINSNTITPVAAGQFVHSLIGSGNNNGGMLANLDLTEIPTSSVTIGSGELDGYEVHTYEYSIALNNTIQAKMIQGKTFDGYISVELAESTQKTEK